MDAITTVIIQALANLGSTVVNDGYEALKTALKHKFGANSKLSAAVEAIESEPDFKPNQEALAGRVAQCKADQDPDIRKLVESLQAQIDKLSDRSGGTNTNISIKTGDHSNVISAVGGDVNLGIRGK